MYSHSVNLPCFQVQFSLHLCPESSLEICWTDPVSCSVYVLYAVASWLISAFNPLPPTFQLLELTGNFLTQLFASLCCFGTFFYYNGLSGETGIKCWYLVHHLELCTLKKKGKTDFLQRLLGHNRNSQFYFLSSFCSPCYLWRNKMTTYINTKYFFDI